MRSIVSPQVPFNQPMLDMSIFSDDDSDASPRNKYYVEYDDDECIEVDQEFRLSPGNSKARAYRAHVDRNIDRSVRPQNASKAGVFNGKKVKTSGYGPIDPQKRRQELLWRERQRHYDVKSKIKETLVELALKKKTEEETAQLIHEKEEARKRKFKEVCLVFLFALLTMNMLLCDYIVS